MTTNTCVNFREKAVFTFIVDTRLTIKSAVMDLYKHTFTDRGLGLSRKPLSNTE